MPPKINGYMLFVSQMKSKGVIDKAMPAPQAVDEAASLWNALSIEEQEVYKQKAKQRNGQVTGLPPLVTRGSNFVPGPNYQGGPIRTNLCSKNKPQLEIYSEDEDFKMEILTEIFGFQLEKEKDVLKTRKFLFGQFLNYIETETTPRNYYPAEFCFIEFSIEEGIGKTFTGPIFPGDLPSGYLYELKENEKNKGLIPYSLAKRNSLAVSISFVELCNKLQEMMDNCSDSCNVIFTEQEEMKIMEGCIRFLFEKAKAEGRSRVKENLKMKSCEVKVLPVQILAQVLMHEFGYLSADIKTEAKDREIKMLLLPSLQSRQILLDSEMNYNRQLTCQNHNLDAYLVGIQFCPLGIVKRWIFKILEYINYPVVRDFYQLGREKDNKHFYKLHTDDVKILRERKLAEAMKKREVEKLERERLEKIQDEENQRLATDFSSCYIIADDDVEEKETYVVIGRGRGRGRGRGIPRNGNNFFFY